MFVIAAELFLPVNLSVANAFVVYPKQLNVGHHWSRRKDVYVRSRAA
jgi:hypothetical protein